MTVKNKRLLAAGTLVAVLLIALAVVAVAVTKHKSTNKYAGLETTLQITIADDQRALLTQRIETNKQAIKTLTAAGQDASAQYKELAWDARLVGDLVLSRETYEAFLKDHPQDMAAWMNYAHILDFMNDWPMAEAAYRQLITIGGGSEGVIRNLVEAIQKQDPQGLRDAEIKKMLEAGVDALGQTPWLMMSLGDWYAKSGDCQAAIDHYNVALSLVAKEAQDSIKEKIAGLKDICQVNTK